MDKYLLRTNGVVNDCERHLTATNTSGTEIESYLTQHTLIILCAEMQQEIYRIAEERAALTNDSHIYNYVGASSKRVLRSVTKSDVANFIGMFGVDIKRKLNGLISDADVTIYNNAVGDRHDIAHKQGVQITFSELKSAITAAEKLLGAVGESLEI